MERGYEIAAAVGHRKRPDPGYSFLREQKFIAVGLHRDYVVDEGGVECY